MPSVLTWLVKPRSLPFLILGLIFFALFLSLGQYDRFSTSFHLPPPPASQLSTTELLLQQQIDAVREKLVEVCPDVPEPVFQQPLLTRSQQERYRHLQNLGGGMNKRAPGGQRPRPHRRGGRYMLTTTIRQIQDQLPDLLNTILVLTMFLGPDKLSFSILEGPSSDCTASILENVLHPLLMSLGVPASSIHLRTREQKIDFSQHNRIEVLADLRNRALEPLWNDRNGVGRDIGAVVFLNDVYMKARDVLELLHQHVKAEDESGQETGITTGWDWYERSPAHYYDVWVGRTVSHQSQFLNICVDANRSRSTRATFFTRSTTPGGPLRPTYFPMHRPPKPPLTPSSHSPSFQAGTVSPSCLPLPSCGRIMSASDGETRTRASARPASAAWFVPTIGKPATVVFR